MLSSLSEVKENVNITNDFTKEDKSSATNSILKPSQKENVSLVQWFTPKKPPKVTFKNTPLCYRPACYKAELFQSRLDTWEEIRNLDEVENWTERTQVVTKEDHQIHLESARGFLEDIINTLPCIKSPEIQTRKVEGKESPNNIDKVVAQETKSVVERAPNKRMDDGLDFEGVGPLDPAIASLNSLLKAGEDEERAFSPIGSERTSPDCDTMVTSEDIEKLLAKHDMPDDGIIPPLELSHGSRIDAMMDSKFSIQSLEEMTAKLDQLKLMSPKLGKGINQIGDEEESLPVKRRGTKTPPGKEAKESKERQEEKENIPESDDFSLPVKKREPKTAPKIGVELNDDNKFKKPMPPKPWKTKNRKVPKQDDQPVVMFPDSGIKVFNGNDTGKLTSKTDESTHTAPQIHLFENDLKHCVSMQEDNTNISVRNSQGSEEQPPLEEKSSLEVNGNEKEKKQYNPFQDDLPATEEDFKLPENEDFKSSGEAFSLELDYLEKFGNTGNLDGLSALARQSLYVKFDPLVKGSPDKDLRQLKADALNSKQKAPANLDDLLLMSTPPNLRAKQPRLAAIKETQGKDTTNLSGVDKLLTFSPLAQASSEDSAKKQVREETKSTVQTTQSQSDDPSLVEPLLYSKSDIAVAVKKEREALLKQTHEESAIRDMEIQEIQSKLQSEIEGNAKLRRENDELRTVMNEYERTMAEMIETSEKNKNMNDESKNEIVKERDQLQADLNSVEAAFSDLHGRYEKLKGVLENYKKNEEILKKATIDYQEKLRKSGEKYQMLKKHAEEKIETANIEINRVRRSNDSEMAVMRAALKKEQNKCASLEQAIQQKINENKELTAICDELIQRASGAK